MATLGLGPVIGQIGGVEVQKIPVEAVTSGGNGTVVVMHTVHVPEGETWLVALAGDLVPNSTGANSPQLSIGEVSTGHSLRRGHAAVVAEVTGTADITLKRNQASNSDLFSGHVYAAPLPD